MVTATRTRCPRPRRNLIRFFVIVAAVIAVIYLYYWRLLRANDGDEQQMDEQALMRLYRQNKDAWLEWKLRMYERRMVPNLGRDGEPAYLTGKAKEMGKKSLKKVALNTVLCDLMPLNRTLRDPRNKG